MKVGSYRQSYPSLSKQGMSMPLIPGNEEAHQRAWRAEPSSSCGWAASEDSHAALRDRLPYSAPRGPQLLHCIDERPRLLH